MSDISVSRIHAEIRNYDGEFYLVDLNSKFGTLALANKPLRVRTSRGLSLQAGRTLLKMSISLPSYCLCLKKDVSPEENGEPSADELLVMKRATQAEIPPESISELINVQPNTHRNDDNIENSPHPAVPISYASPVMMDRAPTMAQNAMPLMLPIPLQNPGNNVNTVPARENNEAMASSSNIAN